MVSDEAAADELFERCSMRLITLSDAAGLPDEAEPAIEDLALFEASVRRTPSPGRSGAGWKAADAQGHALKRIFFATIGRQVVQLDVVAATAAWSLGAALGRTELFRRTSPSIRSWPSAEEPDEIVERVMHRVNGLVGPSASARSEADLSAYDLMVESAYRIVHDPEYHVAEDCVQCLLELQAAGFAVSELLDEAW